MECEDMDSPWNVCTHEMKPITHMQKQHESGHAQSSPDDTLSQQKHERARVCHPDKVLPHLKEWATEEMERLNKTLAVLDEPYLEL